MNLLIFILGRISIKAFFVGVVTLLISFPATAGWNFDFSRRTKEIRKREMNQRSPASVTSSTESAGFFDSFFQSSDPTQELVILNTASGFIPETVNVHVGANYKISVVNVNDSKKNVSFVMDSFSQHHATYYGKIKSFHIQPKKDGIFSFVCPETSAQGRLVVIPSANNPHVRYPASE